MTLDIITTIGWIVIVILDIALIVIVTRATTRTQKAAAITETYADLADHAWKSIQEESVWLVAQRQEMKEKSESFKKEMEAAWEKIQSNSRNS